jgi:hypothetical protein
MKIEKKKKFYFFLEKFRPKNILRILVFFWLLGRNHIYQLLNNKVVE